MEFTRDDGFPFEQSCVLLKENVLDIEARVAFEASLYRIKNNRMAVTTDNKLEIESYINGDSDRVNALSG